MTEEIGPAAGTETPTPGKPGHSGALSWLRDMVVSVLVSAFIIMFLYQPVRVEGTSMLPMLEDQDRLFVNKLAYRVGDIQRGDVVVFLYPHDHSKSYIKRVIALPGDRLRIEQGQVYVNGKELVEDYVPVRFEDSRSVGGDGDAAARVLGDGRPSVDLKRQPGLWAGGPRSLFMARRRLCIGRWTRLGWFGSRIN